MPAAWILKDNLGLMFHSLVVRYILILCTSSTHHILASAVETSGRVKSAATRRQKNLEEKMYIYCRTRPLNPQRGWGNVLGIQ